MLFNASTPLSFLLLKHEDTPWNTYWLWPYRIYNVILDFAACIVYSDCVSKSISISRNNQSLVGTLDVCVYFHPFLHRISGEVGSPKTIYFLSESFFLSRHSLRRTWFSQHYFCRKK